jgi:hypothetical protein
LQQQQQQQQAGQPGTPQQGQVATPGAPASASAGAGAGDGGAAKPNLITKYKQLKNQAAELMAEEERQVAAGAHDQPRLAQIRETLAGLFTEIEHISKIIQNFVTKFEQNGENQSVVQQFHALLQCPPTIEQIAARRGSSPAVAVANGSPDAAGANAKRRNSKKGSTPATPAAGAGAGAPPTPPQPHALPAQSPVAVPVAVQATQQAQVAMLAQAQAQAQARAAQLAAAQAQSMGARPGMQPLTQQQMQQLQIQYLQHQHQQQAAAAILQQHSMANPMLLHQLRLTMPVCTSRAPCVRPLT